MNNYFNRFEQLVWTRSAKELSPRAIAAQRAVRTLLTVMRDLFRGQLTLRAMGLVYTTLLSIVPLLALSFSVLKAFGVYNQIQPILLNFLAPLGEMGEEVTLNIVHYIETIKVGVLGTLGLAMLVYTSVSLMQKIEESLNYIWHIPHPRRLGDRFSRYFSVLMVGPILVFSALGITASVMNIELMRELLAVDVLGQTVRFLTRLMPYVLVTGAFTFAYIFIPNTRVRFLPALIGGIAGGVAWQTAGWVFASFVVSTNNYAAIYSSLAILILFMIWLYLSWLILLFGASVAFYAQHPEYLYAKEGEPHLSGRMRERVALSVMSIISKRFMLGQHMPTFPEITQQIGVPMHALRLLLDELVRSGLVVQSGDAQPAHLLARDPSLITVVQVLDVVRSAGEKDFISPFDLPAPAKVDEVLAQLQTIVESSIGQLTLRELVNAEKESRRPE